MKKILVIFIVLLFVAGGVILAASGAFGGTAGDRRMITDKSHAFFEALQFKRYSDAANFHHPDDRKKADIRQLMKNLFLMPPENLDIQEFTTLMSEVDTKGDGGRVKNQVLVQVLNPKRNIEREVMLYWRKVDGEWWLKLHESLR